MSNPSFVVGVDLGGTNVRAAVVSHDQGKVVARSLNLSSHAMEGSDKTAGQIIEAVKQALENANMKSGDVVGIGIAVPGHVHPAEGKVLWAPNFKDQWRGVYLAKPVSDALGLPVLLGNDANLAAFGEFTYGAGKPVRHMVMLTLGTGIGGGVIIDGKMLLGADGGAAELGHMFVCADRPFGGGARGGNAMFGTLEGMAQRDAICERAARKVAMGRKSSLVDAAYDRHLLTPQDIFNAAVAGDEVALETYEETGYFIGLGVASLINVFNPEMIVIGGGIAQAGDLILDPITRTARVNAIATLQAICKIVPADLGDNAGIMGAAAVAHDSIA